MAFQDEQRQAKVFYSVDVSLYSKVLNNQQICSSFSWTQPTSKKRLQISTHKTHYTIKPQQSLFSKLCLYLFMPEGGNSFANKQKEEKLAACLQECLYDWSLKKNIQRQVMAALIANCLSNNILQTSLNVLC